LTGGRFKAALAELRILCNCSVLATEETLGAGKRKERDDGEMGPAKKRKGLADI